jgi:2,4-dienoyl-CoA reductase-like NADH-dependent reductase (Old Yellow Enzyme family)
LADRVHAHGAYTMCQLTHMGRRTVWDAGSWLPTISSSSIREHSHRSFPKEMEEFDIRRVVRSYGEAARRAKEGGLDGVEIIAYGHLVDQFWSPITNKRTDRYGGALENRMRFSLEVFESVREQVGDDFIVGIRMPGTEDRDAGLTLDDCRNIAVSLVKTGMVDFVNVIKGWIGTDEALSHVIPGLGTPLGAHLPVAAAIKDSVDVPVFHASRIADLATARYAISEGLIDMVGMTRAHMADPHIVNKLEAGEEDRIRPCVGASYCINRLYLGHDALCIHNPATGREETIPHVVESVFESRRVIVVGGGPAGLEAARVCAERGHAVTLFEASSELGGQIVLAARATDRRRDLIGISEWLASECRHLGVDIRLNTPADGSDVTALDPDVVIVATGGWPRTSFLADGEHLVATTWDIVTGTVKPSTGEVLVFDDHGTEDAFSCVERMVAAGSKVEMVSPDRHVGFEVTGLAYPSYLKFMYEHDVRLTPDHRLTAVRKVDGRLECTLWNDYTKSTNVRMVDQVVVEHGTEPMADVYFELRDASSNGGATDLDALLAGRPQPRGSGFQLFRVGDAVASRNIHAAIYDSRRLCKDL